MKHLLVLLATGIVAISGLEHVTTYKSFEDATRECAEYYQLDENCIQRFLANPESGCSIDPRLVRCVLLDLVAWDDATGTQESVLRQFFQPAGCCDRDYRRRTAECVQQQLANYAGDANGRANEAFRCYLRHYGTLIRQEKKFIPLGKEAMKQLKLDDFLMSNTPQCVLAEIARGDFVRDDELATLFFIGTVRSGYVDSSDKRKLSLDKIYTQFGNPELLSPKTVKCIDDVIRECGSSGDVVQIFYKQYKRCLQNLTYITDVLQEVARTLLDHPTSYIHPSSGCSNSCGCRSDHRYYYPSN